MAKPQTYPLIFCSAYTREAGEAITEAASGVVPTSRILRSAVDLWRAQHRWLMQQGYSALTATQYLLQQTERPAPPQPQPVPQPMPQPMPMQSPFQQMTGTNGR